MSINTLDLAGFRAVNGLAGRWLALDAVGIFGAKYLIYLMAALMLAYVASAWKTDRFEDRVENAWHVFWSAVIAFIFEQAIGFFWFRARPFVALENVVKLIDKSGLEKSFPSGHASASFAIAIALYVEDKRWGAFMLALAAYVSISRVYVGVHYPTDIIGGFFVGLAAAFLAKPVKKAVEPYLELFPVFRKFKKKT